MTFEQAIKLAAEIRDYFRRIELVAVGTFGRPGDEWGCSVLIDRAKEHRRVVWKREDLADLCGDLIRQCDACEAERPLYAEFCECGGVLVDHRRRRHAPRVRKTPSAKCHRTSWRRSPAKTRDADAFDEDAAPAGMLF